MIAYTDGGSIDNPDGEAAWAVYLDDNDNVSLKSGRMPIGSNNAAELKAVIEALRLTPSNKPLTIISDSMYVVGTATKNWMRRANVELWKEFDRLVKGRDVEFLHVRGHNGEFGNEVVDAAVNRTLGRKLTRRETERLTQVEWSLKYVEL